jgi:hypothetical protein
MNIIHQRKEQTKTDLSAIPATEIITVSMKRDGA